MDVAIEAFLMSDVRLSATPFPTYGVAAGMRVRDAPKAPKRMSRDAWMT
jgi:hypothetical protein